jgi:hypothetical protein
MHIKCETRNLERESFGTLLKIILSSLVCIHFTQPQRSVIFVLESLTFLHECLLDLGCGCIAFQARDCSRPICVGVSLQLYTPHPGSPFFNLLQPLVNCQRGISHTLTHTHTHTRARTNSFILKV